MTDTKTNQQWTGSANARPENLTSYPLDITYTGPMVGGTSDSGTIVTNKKTDVHAGWPIEVGVSFAPSDLADEFDWTIAGAGGNGSAAIGGYSHTSESATVYALGQQYGYSVLYYYTASGSHNVSVTTKNGYAVPSVTTTFIVAAPTMTLTAKYQYPAQLAPVGSGPEQWIYLQATQSLTLPGFTSPSQAGIVFYHPFVHDKQFHGGSYFVQVYTWDHEYSGISGKQNWTTAGAGLDTSDPYPGGNMLNQPIAGDYEEEDGPQITTDAINQVNYSPVSVQDSPTMWVMYTPRAGGSIDVPLATCMWPWGGTATWNPATGTWAFSNQHPAAAGNASTSPTHTYPTWSQLLNPPAMWTPPK